MARTLIRQATIISVDPKVGDLRRGDILIDGSRIAAIAPKIEAGDAEVIDVHREAAREVMHRAADLRRARAVRATDRRLGALFVERARLKEQLEMGVLDDRKVEVEVEEAPTSAAMPIFPNQNAEEMGMNFQEMLSNLMPGKKRTRTMTVAEAREALIGEEARKLIDQDAVKREAVERAQQDGIIFVDEIDKIATRDGGSGPDVSRGGVQRDILPIIEGSTVQTKFGPVRTDHVLFIAAGAGAAAPAGSRAAPWRGPRGGAPRAVSATAPGPRVPRTTRRPMSPRRWVWSAACRRRRCCLLPRACRASALRA